MNELMNIIKVATNYLKAGQAIEQAIESRKRTKIMQEETKLLREQTDIRIKAMQEKTRFIVERNNQEIERLKKENELFN